MVCGFGKLGMNSLTLSEGVQFGGKNGNLVQKAFCHQGVAKIWSSPMDKGHFGHQHEPEIQ